MSDPINQEFAAQGHPEERPELLFVSNSACGAWKTKKVTIYRAWSPIDGEAPSAITCAAFEKRGEFRAPVRERLRTPIQEGKTGLYFVKAAAHQGAQTAYDYALLVPFATIDTTTHEITALPAWSPGEPVIGLTQWDVTLCDTRNGHFYVSATEDRGRRRTVPAVGPFSRHIDALLLVDAAWKHFVGEVNQGRTAEMPGLVGTINLRLDPGQDYPAGLLNAALIKNTQRKLLCPDFLLQRPKEPEEQDDSAQSTRARPRMR